jgi:hypothetical protein
VYLIQLDQNRAQWLVVVNTVIELLVSRRRGQLFDHLSDCKISHALLCYMELVKYNKCNGKSVQKQSIG